MAAKGRKNSLRDVLREVIRLAASLSQAVRELLCRGAGQVDERPPPR